MERIKKLLAIPLLFSSFAGVSAIKVEPGEYNIIHYFYCEPLKEKGVETKIHISCDSTFGTGYKGRIYLRLTNSRYNRLLVAYYDDQYAGYKSCTLIYENLYNTTGANMFSLEYTKDGQSLTKIPFVLDYLTPENITTEDCYRGSFSQHLSIYSPDGENIGWHDDEFTFTNFDEVKYQSFYSKLDLSDLKIKEKVYGSYKKPNVESVVLKLPNNMDCFNDVGYVTNNERLIDLAIIDESENNYALSFKNDLYVNPVTYQMSSVKHDGYVKTKSLFLPHNEISRTNSYTFSIRMTGFGEIKTNLNYDFEVNALRNAFGDCVTSEYCVQTSPVSYQGLIGEKIK